MKRMRVDVSSTSPILWMDVDVDDFGRIFSAIPSDEQVAVLAAMVKHMTPHPQQWDYIAIEMEKPENEDLRITLRDIFQEQTQ